MFYLISKQREVIYQTREKVFYRICKDPRKCVLSDTKYQDVICQRREGVFLLYLKNKSLDWKRARRKEYFKPISSVVTSCQVKDSLQCTISRLKLRPKLE